MRSTVGPAGAHPLPHPLPLVAGGGMITNAIQTDLVWRLEVSCVTAARTHFRSNGLGISQDSRHQRRLKC
jgi:hypothetical protein